MMSQKTINAKLPFRPFLMFPMSLIKDRKLSSHARAVYLALLVFASKDDQKCYATTETFTGYCYAESEKALFIKAWTS
jgi:hypothetical protein